MTRLYAFTYNLARTQRGFIPEIIKLLQKYGLTDHFQSWLQDGSIANKPAWKRTVRTAVSSFHKLQRQNRFFCDPDLSTFSQIFHDTKPSSIWDMPRNCHEINLCKFICKLSSNLRKLNETYVCSMCQKTFTNVFVHAACACLATFNIREQWWYNIVNLFDIRLSAELCALTNDDLFLILLGRQTNTKFCNAEYVSFRMLNYKLVHNTATLYNRATSFKTTQKRDCVFETLSSIFLLYYENMFRYS